QPLCAPPRLHVSLSPPPPASSYVCSFFSLLPPAPRSPLFPYTTLFRSGVLARQVDDHGGHVVGVELLDLGDAAVLALDALLPPRSEEHTSELQSLAYLVWRLLLEKKKLGLARGCGSGLLLARGPVAGEV